VYRSLLVLSLLTLLGGDAAQGQDVPGPLGDSIPAFQARRETVAWLLAYDRAAWLTSDVVMKEPASLTQGLGREWFCLRIGDVWHAFYGRYDVDADSYRTVLHYELDSERQVTRSTAAVDTTRTTALARALYWAHTRLPAHFTGVGFTFNHYIRVLGDSAIEVWYLPGWHPRAEVMVYGGEARFTFDVAGREERARHVLLDSWRGYPLGDTTGIVLNYEQHALPTVGSLFYLYSNWKNFGKITIVTREYRSTLVNSPEGLMLIHALRAKQ
jgi:hypothetical protein